ncbi:MAG: hypothetical protein NTZ10_02335 [Candidatus Saganbacteria bacterium]|nr:hypothetical protein [Candidatus Saganbacteria bacterium]
MSTRPTLAVAGSIKHLPHITRAAETLHRLTDVRGRVYLGLNERPVTPETTVLGPEHLPNGCDGFRNAQLAFLAGAARVERGKENLLVSFGNRTILSVQDMIAMFSAHEMGEYATGGIGWPTCGRTMEDLNDLNSHMLNRIFWWLNDMAYRMPHVLDHSLQVPVAHKPTAVQQASRGRALVTPAIARKLLALSDKYMVMGLNIATRRSTYEARRFSMVDSHRFTDTINEGRWVDSLGFWPTTDLGFIADKAFVTTGRNGQAKHEIPIGSISAVMVTKKIYPVITD